MRGVPATLACPFIITTQCFFIIGVNTVFYYYFSTFARGKPTQVGKALLCYKYVYVVLAVVYVRYHGYYVAYAVAFFRRSLGYKDAQVGITGKITRATNTIHHFSARKVCGIYIAVDIKLYGCVYAYNAQPAYYFGGIAYVLGAEYNFIFIPVKVFNQMVVHWFRNGYGGC